jgi:peptidoglycan-associated lipoprotein
MFLKTLKQFIPATALSCMFLVAGCHKKAPLPPPPPPPPAAASPTATLNANPTAIEPGQATTLDWKTTDADQVSISDIGTVPTAGTHSVTPAASTTYTLTAKGPGGSTQATVRVTVNAPPPPPPPTTSSLSEDELFAQSVGDIYFNYDRYTLRPEDASIVEKDASFLSQHPNMNIVIEGHCDDRGSEEYNLALGQSRADSMKKALVSAGIPASRIRAITYGKEKPFCTEETDACWQQNRRDHLTLAH